MLNIKLKIPFFSFSYFFSFFRDSLLLLLSLPCLLFHILLILSVFFLLIQLPFSFFLSLPTPSTLHYPHLFYLFILWNIFRRSLVPALLLFSSLFVYFPLFSLYYLFALILSLYPASLFHLLPLSLFSPSLFSLSLHTIFLSIHFLSNFPSLSNFLPFLSLSFFLPSSHLLLPSLFFPLSYRLQSNL